MISIIENIKEHGLKYITPKRAWVWIRSKIRRLLGYRIKESDAITFAEIVAYKSITCPDCVQLGHCRVCKCPINELFTAMDVGCSADKFPAFEQDGKHWRDGWKEYKEDQGILLNIFYTK